MPETQKKVKVVIEVEIDMAGNESAARVDIIRNIRNAFVGKYGSGLEYDYMVCDILPYVDTEITKLLAKMKAMRGKSK